MDGATANAGRKWHDQSVHFWSESTRELVVVSPLQPGHPLPDLARGTGGLGVLLNTQRVFFRYDNLAVIIVELFVLVFVIEQLSIWLRRRLV